MDSLRGCVFSEEFRRSLTDLSDLPDIDAEDREKLFLLLQKFLLKVDFRLNINLQHLISQLFGTAEPSDELLLTLTPVVIGVENELPDEEPITAELAAMLYSPIGTTFVGEDLSLRNDIDQAGELTTNCYISIQFSLLFISIYLHLQQ